MKYKKLVIYGKKINQNEHLLEDCSMVVFLLFLVHVLY